MTPTHQIAAANFVELSTGRGGARAIVALRDSRLSRTLLLLRYIASQWPADRSERDAAIDVLAEAQLRSPGIIREVLSEPHVGAWAACATRRLRGSKRSTVPVEIDLAHLSAIAAVAAMRTEVDADLTTRARDCGVFLPSLGRVRIAEPGPEPVRLHVRAGVLTIVCRTEATVVGGPGFDQLRRLSADTGDPPLSLFVDDVDPYRGGHHVPPADRLSAAQFRQWTDRFGEAWALLSRHAPHRTDELAAGLRSVVPLVDSGPGVARSATSLDAFGSLGLTLPNSPADLAVTLVHEFQHSKLGAIHGLVALYDPSHTATYFAPWRTDPRPVGGLFQGVYAFLAVADVWRSLRADPLLSDDADGQFAYAREQVRVGLTALVGSGSLTAAGVRFAIGLRGALDGMLATTVPDRVTVAAREALDEAREAWRQRNGRAT